MRASTIFALIIAVLAGLAVAVAVRASGLLSKAEAKELPPPKLVLVAAHPIHEGQYLFASDVRLRPATSQEEQDLANPTRAKDYVDPTPNAVVRARARRELRAGVPIMQSDLELAYQALHDRIMPGKRAVNLAVLKAQCAGGLIEVGDYVEVLLTSSVENPLQLGGAKTATGTIARNVRVIAKRNDLFPKETPLGPECLVNYTLELNPYRAALLEYVKDKGIITLNPMGQRERDALESARLRAEQDGIVMVTYDVRDLENEKKLVDEFTQAGQTVGEEDLVKIFNLPQLVVKPPPQPTAIQRITGITPSGEHLFYPDGSSPRAANGGVQTVAQVTTAGGQPVTAYRFRPPGDCPQPRKG